MSAQGQGGNQPIYILKEGKVAREIVDKSEISDTRGLEEYL